MPSMVCQRFVHPIRMHPPREQPLEQPLARQSDLNCRTGQEHAGICMGVMFGMSMRDHTLWTGHFIWHVSPCSMLHERVTQRIAYMVEVPPHNEVFSARTLETVFLLTAIITHFSKNG